MKSSTLESLTDKIKVEQTPDHIHVQFDTPYHVISSAVLNGGLVEARAAALQNLDIKSPVSNETATGTDCIAIASDPKAQKLQYCGKHVLFGETLARLVIEALTSSVKG